MTNLTIDTTQVKAFEADLKRFAERAYPFATKATINGAAFKARELAQAHIRGQLVLRNRYTLQSIQVDQARTLNVNQQTATVGSTAAYMRDQEFGGTKQAKGRNVAIATSYAAGEGESVRPRRKLPRKPNKLSNIALRRRSATGTSSKARNAAVIQDAAASGQKYVYLELSRRKGIFRVLGTGRSIRIKMVWDLTRRSVRVPRAAWLAPSVAAARQSIPTLYAQALVAQLQRHGVFDPRRYGGRA